MYMLKSVGERTPVLNWSCIDVCSLNVVCLASFHVVYY